MLSLQANAPAKIKIEGLQYETKSAWQQSSSQFTILKILHKCFNVRCESSIF